jgi:hypothetical protein
MSPEVQIIVQATNYIMTGLLQIYALLAVVMGLVSTGFLADRVSTMYHEHMWGTPKMERFSTAIQTGLALGGLILAIVVLT